MPLLEFLKITLAAVGEVKRRKARAVVQVAVTKATEVKRMDPAGFGERRGSLTDWQEEGGPRFL